MKSYLHTIFKFLILGISILNIQSCATNKKIMSVAVDTDCPPVMDYIFSDFLPLDKLLTDTFLLSSYSTESIIVANAYGLIDDIRLLQTLINLENRLNSSDSIKLKRLEKMLEIENTMNLAKLELQTLQTFLNCNNRKLIGARTNLEQLNNKTRSSYTNSAIIIGVVSSALVAGALVDDGEVNRGSFKDWVGVAGGLVAAGLAIKSERVNKKIKLKHANNAIPAVWNGVNDQGIFTDNTWYLLNQPHISGSSELSIRDSIIEVWKTSESILLKDENKQYISFLLGNEAEYTEDMIKIRIEMLEDIKHSIVDVSRLLSLFTFENQQKQSNIE